MIQKSTWYRWPTTRKPLYWPNGTRGSRFTLKPRACMVGSRVQRDKGYDTATFTPGYLKPKNEIDPSKTIIRLPGEDPAALNSPSYRRIRLIHDALRRQAKSIKARVEWLAVNAITTGKNTIEGEGIERYELDWKLPAANIIFQAAGKKWSEQDRNNFDP
ncbi:TPA: hypothetical protein G9F27_005858, partial [Salmonella enterica]|nr:hypothetical protein [Salmonella enterica]